MNLEPETGKIIKKSVIKKATSANIASVLTLNQQNTCENELKNLSLEGTKYSSPGATKLL